MSVLFRFLKSLPTAAVGLILRGGTLVAAGLLMSVVPATAAEDLDKYSDFGRADILLTAATIQQSGIGQIALIEQTTDIGGLGNIAQTDQSGSTNAAYVTQIGDLNRARVVQSDSGNQVTISQRGIGNSIDVLQSGVGNQLNGLQQGDGNVATIAQSGGSNVAFSEIGNNNTLKLDAGQTASSIPVVIVINGNGMTVTQR